MSKWSDLGYNIFCYGSLTLLDFEQMSLSELRERRKIAETRIQDYDEEIDQITQELERRGKS